MEKVKRCHNSKFSSERITRQGVTKHCRNIDENSRFSPAGCYVLATDFEGEFLIGLMLENKEGKHTPLWGEDYICK